MIKRTGTTLLVLILYLTMTACSTATDDERDINRVFIRLNDAMLSGNDHDLVTTLDKYTNKVTEDTLKSVYYDGKTDILERELIQSLAILEVRANMLRDNISHASICLVLNHMTLDELYLNKNKYKLENLNVQGDVAVAGIQVYGNRREVRFIREMGAWKFSLKEQHDILDQVLENDLNASGLERDRWLLDYLTMIGLRSVLSENIFDPVKSQ